MPASIITIVNQKGGVGKTLLSMSLASTLARRGSKVLVADADPQGTASQWAARAADERPFPATVVSLAAHGPKLHAQIRRFTDEYDFILIDCPPHLDAPQPKSALLVSDLALVPVLPSAESAWAAAAVLHMIEDVRTINETLRVAMVITQAQTGTCMTRDFRDVLADFNTPVLDSCMYLRQAYRQAVLLGGTVHDLGASAKSAVDELEKLTSEVLAFVDKVEPQT